MKYKMLVLTNRQLHNGPRMIREFAAFQNDFHITAFGTSAPGKDHVQFENITPYNPLHLKILNAVFRRLFYKRLTTHIAEYYPAIEEYILKNSFDVVIIHDPMFLPLISRLKKKMSFLSVYNAHEYHPLEFEEIENWTNTIGRYAYSLYEKNLTNVDILVNVCDGIAHECEKSFQKESLVIPNVAIQSNIQPFYNTGVVKLIYHGAIMQSRNIEAMIDVMNLLGDHYTLQIMGVVNGDNAQYLNHLKEYAKKTGNVSFTDPVPFDQIVQKINEFDIGLFLLQPNNFNYTHALPNKLYEFIQAKLAVAIGPSVEMKQVVEKYDLGVVSEDFSAESLARKIASLSREDIAKYKQNAVAASAIENAAHYSAIYLQKIKSLLKV